MMTGREKQITVNKERLIAKLKENLAQHKADYAEAVVGYKIKLLADLEAKHYEVSENSDLAVLEIKPVSFNPPRSYAKEYEDAIIMAEWTEGDTIQLDQTTFKQYVQNEWSWSGSFEVMATSYKSFVAGAAH